MEWQGNCRTTAMGIMPHDNVNNAIDLALSLDIPFWPQLQKVSFFEDMYVQASEGFPGITLDIANEMINFSTELFYEQLPDYLERSEDSRYFEISEQYSMVYKSFLATDLTPYPAIRGQLIGPVSFGMKIHDEELKPIIYDSEVKGLLYEFMAKKINVQYHQLKAKNPHAFMWVDEPGLEIIFGSFTGYASETAREDYRTFLQNLDAPIGIHLCGNPDWSFLLQQDISILSFDAFTCGHVFTRYADEVKAFLAAGRYIAWGIVPTLTQELADIQAQDLVTRTLELWDYLVSKGVPRELILRQGLLAPSRCCLLNADGTKTVEKSFAILREVSQIIRDKFNLND
ncbi:MAG: hypothetical protein M0Z55_07200 [Peptococcaceae bacterium]|nr:hypothetical protein [Peptococcaceae bacterium]